MNTNFLNWFTGKSLEGAREALGLLRISKSQGFWVPGGSRRVMATLSKANVATKFSKANQKVLEMIGVPEGRGQYEAEFRAVSSQGWEAAHDMYFGAFTRVQRVDFDVLRQAARPHEVEAIKVAAQYAADFAEVAALVTELDRTRPQPVFTALGISRTTTETLARLDLIPESVRVCPLVYDRVEKTEEGHTFIAFVARLVWPEGTVHNQSRFHSTNSNSQCQACGHAIKNSLNWVPLLVNNAAGVPHSLWVGRDCSKKLFGIEMKGDLEVVR